MRLRLGGLTGRRRRYAFRDGGLVRRRCQRRGRRRFGGTVAASRRFFEALFPGADRRAVIERFVSQCRRTCLGARCLAPDLRPWLRRLARYEAVQHDLELVRRQILKRVAADLNDRRIGAYADALDLFPRERAVGARNVLMLADAPFANSDEIARTAQHARRRATHLHVGLAADRRKLKHRIERRDFDAANIGHVEQIADGTDRGFGKPAAGLLLSAPHQRKNGGRFFAGRILGNRRMRPRKIFRRESELRRLIGMQSANGHLWLLERQSCGGEL